MKYILSPLNAADFGASGSAFETTGVMAAGSCELTLQDPGDFAVGQEVKVFGGAPRCESFRLFGPHGFHARNRKVEGEVELRFDGRSEAERLIYFLDFDPKTPDTFRWTDDQGRSWHENPLDHEWQSLSNGVEVRLDEHDWGKGWVVTIVLCSSFTAQILDIQGDTLTLDTPARTDVNARIIHSDTAALQRAIDAAIERHSDLCIPEGHYRLSETLRIDDADSLTIIGSGPRRTTLDIGSGSVGIEAPGGSCIAVKGGGEVNLCDLSFRGASGFAERDRAGHMQTKGATGVWGFYFMKCNALSVWGTERVYVENCHARGMSAECFYSASPETRTLDAEPAQYTKSITYMRCSVEDCARNAFNNNDFAENTHLIDCRIRDVGGCTWEGASRFVEMRGCYVRNAGSVAMGNVRSRDERFERLGTGQHIITDNTFEGGHCYGLAMLAVGAAASQVIIKNNNFVNSGGNAIWLCGDTGMRDLPSQNILVQGNIFNMTAEDTPSRPRMALDVTTCDVTIADNQIYSTVPDENITPIRLRDDARGILIHDNLIRRCGETIACVPVQGRVGEALDDRRFTASADDQYGWAMPPLLRRRSHRYRGWEVCWESGDVSVMEDFDPESCIFTLREPRALRSGEQYTLKPRYEDGREMNERLIHDNLVL